MTNTLLFSLLALFWGGSFIAIKVVVHEIPPFGGAALRVMVGLAGLFAILKAMKKPTAVPWDSRWRLWLTGLFSQGFPFALLFWGERSISAGLAGLINGTVPLWTFTLGAALASEPAAKSPRAWGGVALGFAGTALIFWPTLVAPGPGELGGVAACLGMALCYAIGSLIARTVLVGDKAVDVYAGVLHQQVAATAFLAILAAATGSLPVGLSPTPAAWGSILYLGLASTAVAFLIFFRLIRDWGSLRASAVTYVMPVVTLILDQLFFGHWPKPTEAAGAAIVLAGVILLHFQKSKAAP